MLKPGTRPAARLLAFVLPLAALPPSSTRAETEADPAASLERAIASAESSLRDGEIQIAESRYRSALLEGWLLVGGLEAADGRLPEARDAFRRASTATVDARRALQSLALVHLHMGEAGEAVGILTRLAARTRDLETRRLLTQALVADGRPEQAVQELEEARAAAPGDLELAFMLASGYLRLEKADAAEPLFAQVAKARPIPQTHVLIGRTYRDFGEYGRARTELLLALKLDPRVRRAHYYLGMVAVTEEGTARLEEAIGEFRKELKLAPQDPLTNLRLGMALVEAQRPSEALPALELAARAASPPADAFHYLGRCLLALDRPADAAAALRRALGLSAGPVVDEARILSIHYQLALALQRTGAIQEAAVHFAEAERSSARRADTSRERLARYLADTPEPGSGATPVAPPVDASPLAALAPPQRLELKRRVTAALARASLNLGIMQAQSERFGRAAELFAEAAALDADFPQVQYSLGVAHFNAQQFDKATTPLARALEADPRNADLRRMLALAWLHSGAYDEAVDLLRADAERSPDPSLRFAYGLALVRSGHAAEAQAIFSRLLAQHGDSAELSVVLGQAHAQQGDYEAAVVSLRRALELKPDVAEANATLGLIFLKQGRLPEAEQALRTEIAAHPADLESRHTLATVLDLEGRREEAISLLRGLLKSKPEFVDARYLLGKVLLAQGMAAEAAEHLEAAARLAPEDANTHYQLGQAYQKLGRTDLAQQQFEVFRQLKEKRRGSAP